MLFNSASSKFSKTSINAALTLLILALLPVSFTSATELFVDSFEDSSVGSAPKSGNKRKGVHNNWGKCHGNCLTVTSEQARSGKKSAKVYLNRLRSKRSKYRTEAIPRSGPYNYKQDYWYGFSIFVPNDHLPDFISGDIVFQMHGSHDKGEPSLNPNLALYIDGNNWNLTNRWSPKRIVKSRQDGESKNWNLGSVNKGEWTDFVIHGKWSYENDGVLQVWQNKKLVINQKGPNSWNDAYGAPYPNLGLYKTAWRGVCSNNNCFDQNIVERTYYHDEIRIAMGKDAKFSDVDPSRGGKGSPDSLPAPTNLQILTSSD